MKIALVLLLAVFLMNSTQSADAAKEFLQIAGDFGRAWLSNDGVQNPRSIGQDNQTDAYNIPTWSDASKSNNSSDRDWLNATALLGSLNLMKNNTTSEAAKKIPYHISNTFKPIHEIDSSFNQSKLVPQLPQPDKNGLINGIPAEIYYAIGPAYYDF
mgnify:FL=1|jgi:hypothetical protein